MAKQTIGLILAALLLAGGVWYAVKRERPPTTPISTGQNQNATTTEWKTYRNEEFGFEFQYPSSLKDYFVSAGVNKFIALPKTITEACEDTKELFPFDTECVMRPITQEDILNDQRAIMSGSVVNGEVVDVGGTRGRRDIFYGKLGGEYYARLVIYDKDSNKISIEVTLRGENMEEAAQDPRNQALDRIIFTFRFTK